MSRPVVKPAPPRPATLLKNAARKPTTSSPRAGPSNRDGDYLYTAGIRDASNRITEYRVSSLPASLLSLVLDMNGETCWSLTVRPTTTSAPFARPTGSSTKAFACSSRHAIIRPARAVSSAFSPLVPNRVLTPAAGKSFERSTFNIKHSRISRWKRRWRSGGALPSSEFHTQTPLLEDGALKAGTPNAERTLQRIGSTMTSWKRRRISVSGLRNARSLG